MNDKKQIPLDFSFYENKSFFNYIPGNNIFIIDMLRKAANDPSYNLIFLRGESASGKTHLCSAAFDESRKIKLFLDLTKISKITEYQITNIELLIIDDFDSIINKSNVEEKIFFLINDLIIRKKSIILTSSLEVDKINFKLEDLKSRVCSDQMLEIQELNDLEKISLLKKIAKNRGWQLTDNVSNYILNHFDRDLYFLYNVIRNIDKESLAEKKKITIPFIKKILYKKNKF